MTNKLFLIGVLCTIVLLIGIVLTLGGNPHGSNLILIGSLGAIGTIIIAKED
jgi:hypothetical protein